MFITFEPMFKGFEYKFKGSELKFKAYEHNFQHGKDTILLGYKQIFLALISDILRNQSISYHPSSGRYRAWRGRHACSVARVPSRQTSDTHGA